MKCNQKVSFYFSMVTFYFSADKKQGFSRKLRASIDRIKALRVKLPSLEFQDQIADITDKIEKKINEYKIELDRLEKEKEKILQKYLFS
ncbi:hypothetical protein WGU85_00735 [Campylobacter jejuni]